MSFDKFLNLNDPKVLSELENSIKSKESILFVGAGCSFAIGFPSWGGLLQNLNNDLCASQVNGQGKDALTYAKEIKEHLRNKKAIDDYYSFMNGTFKKPPSRKTVGGGLASAKMPAEEWPESMFHKKVFEVPFKAFVTTNYDPALDYYLKKYFDKSLKRCVPEEKGEVGDFLYNLHKPNTHQGVYHLHGRYERPQEIILCKDDYERAYRSSEIPEPIHKKSMWAIFTTRPVIFVGFSLEDEYFVGMLDSICRDTWSKFGDTKHFALMPYNVYEEGSEKAVKRDELRVRVEKNYGVKVVYYDPIGDHIELCNLIGIDSGESSRADEGEQDANESNVETNNDKAIEVAQEFFRKIKK